ncbi:MAG TPA: PH domain-containing protein [Actinomycetes bacterium]|nr:PH domain-containing protein [Actinomycetes bacterium]
MTETADTPGWRRLDSRMLLVQPVTELARALPVLIPLVLFGTRNGGGAPWGLLATAVVAVRATLRWATTTYRITADAVQVRSGLLRRTSRTVPRDRVRTVDVTAHPLHRALGLARVAIGTGRSDRREDEGVRLDGLTSGQAAELREQLLVGRTSQPAHPSPGEPAGVVVARLDPSWVRFAPFTLSGVVTILALAGLVWNAINDSHVDLTRLRPLTGLGHRLAAAPLGLVVGAVAAALLAVVSLAAVAGYLLAYWGHRLERAPDGTLHVTRGLLTRRATTVEGRRLRGAELSQPLLLRGVGGARTLAVATGLRVGRGADRGGTILLPPAPLAVARAVAAQVLAAAEPPYAPLRRHGRRATRRRYSRAGAVAVLVLVAVVGLGRAADSPAWVSVAVGAGVVAVALLLAADRARGLGHTLVDGVLVSSAGAIDRRRVMLEGGGIIGWNWRASWFQRRAGLVTLTATTAAGRQAYHVLDVPVSTSATLAAEVLPDLVEPFLAGEALP